MCLDVTAQPLVDILEMTAVGFEPTPFRTGAKSQRLRPLGQTVLVDLRLLGCIHLLEVVGVGVLRVVATNRALQPGVRLSATRPR